MTCSGCVAKVTQTIQALPGVESVNINLHEPQGVIASTRELSIDNIQSALTVIGNYKIFEYHEPEAIDIESDPSDLGTYKPLFMIVAFIFGFSFLSQFPFDNFSLMIWMRHFMTGFFVVFSFFKLLNIKGFADAYKMYDIVAAKWNSWGYIYPFIELTLGVFYLINFSPLLTNTVTVIVLGVSSVGVIKSNLDKRKIKCACLGDVFNLPMSTVTIIEDLSMVVMAIGMLVWMTF